MCALAASNIILSTFLDSSGSPNGVPPDLIRVVRKNPPKRMRKPRKKVDPEQFEARPTMTGSARASGNLRMSSMRTLCFTRLMALRTVSRAMTMGRSGALSALSTGAFVEAAREYLFAVLEGGHAGDLVVLGEMGSHAIASTRWRSASS